MRVVQHLVSDEFRKTRCLVGLDSGKFRFSMQHIRHVLLRWMPTTLKAFPEIKFATITTWAYGTTSITALSTPKCAHDVWSVTGTPHATTAKQVSFQQNLLALVIRGP